MSSSERPLDPSTLVVACARPAKERDAPLNPPIVLSSTFVGAAAPIQGERVYGRYTNPSWEPLEEAIAELEGSSAPGLAYASGMAAVSAALSLVPIGGTLVAPVSAYNGTLALARSLAEQGALTLRTVDPADTEATLEALPGADVLWLESPTNPLMEVAELRVLLAAARQHDVLSVVDNTFCTPLRQRPLELGADVVVHSATKFISGHSDVLMGLAVCADPAVRANLAARRTLAGSVPGPFEAWLALRGLRTLALRMDRAEASAATLAERLSVDPFVKALRYPGLPSDPGHARAAAQMSGFGALLCIQVGNDAHAAEAFVDALRLITPATSLGGVESLAERRRRHPGEPDVVPENLVRLSIGIEHPEDLWADLHGALRAAELAAGASVD